MDWDVILKIVTLVFGSGGIACVFLWRRKLNAEQKAKANEKFTEKRIDALLNVKQISEKLRVYELINLTHPEFFGTGFGGISEDHWAYKTIMESKESLQEYVEEVMRVRHDNEYWLSNKMAAALWFFERFLLRMQQYFSNNIFGQDIYPYGLLFFNDLERFYKYLIEVINEGMNDPPISNETHSGENWEFAKEDVVALFNDTVLDKLESNDEETCEILGMMQVVYQQNVSNDTSVNS